MPQCCRIVVTTIVLAVCMRSPQMLWADIPSQFSQIKHSDSIRFVKAIGNIPPQHAHTITGVAFSNDGKLAFSSGQFPQLAIWNLKTGSQVRHWNAHDTDPRAVSFASDDEVAISTGHSQIKLWDVASGNLIKTIKTKPLVISSCAIAHDGRSI